MDEEWRVSLVDFVQPAGGKPVSAGTVRDLLRRRGGAEVSVTGGKSGIFLYAATGDAATAAEGIAREVLAQQGLAAGIRVVLPGFGGTGYRMLEHGPAGALAGHGHRVVLPDFRRYGDSAKPCDPTGYPPDVHADDGFALVEHLGLGEGDYDLGGYSLGARVVGRMLARGAAPGRAIVAGQGLANVSGPQAAGRITACSPRSSTGPRSSRTRPTRTGHHRDPHVPRRALTRPRLLH